MYLSNCIWQNVFFSCVSISLIKCQRCLGLLFNVKNQKWLSEWVSEWVSQWLSEWQGHLLSCSGQLKIYLSWYRIASLNAVSCWPKTKYQRPLWLIFYNKILTNVHVVSRSTHGGKNLVSDGTFCTTFCSTQPKQEICTHYGHIRHILGLCYFQILVL